MPDTPLISLEYELTPGHGLGPFVLGSSLWTILEFLKESKTAYPQIEIKYDPENSVTSPVILHLKPYIDLLFSGTQQRLHTVSLRQLRNTGIGVPLTIKYKNVVLVSPEQPLRKLGITRTFGPTYPGDVMRYPGVWFGFTEDGEELGKSLKLGQGDDRTVEVRRIVIRQKVTDSENSNVLDEILDCPVMHGDIHRVIVKIHDGITIYFHPSTKEVVHVRLGISTAEDLTCDLGSPLRIHYKEDDRMTIHSFSHSPDEQDEADYFYNYFQHGIDFLISGNTHRVRKIILHTNVPGSPAFQRYMRCPWEIHGSEDGSTSAVSFWDKADKITRALNPLETPPSMELDRIDDERLCLPNSKTQLMGYDGAVCEISIAHVITLMLF